MRPYYEEDGITIYHGDCRDVLPALDVKADLLVTDPPYGINYKSGSQCNFGPIVGDDDSTHIPDCIRLALNSLKNSGSGGGAHIYIFGNFDLSHLPLSQTCELIWDKQHIGVADLSSPWGPQHERITFGVHAEYASNRQRGAGNLSARMRKGSVLRVPRFNGRSVNDHPTEKPVLLMRQLIESSSVIGGLVLDPFMGSGSTLVAARIESRRAIGIEIEERYCEIAARRLAQQVFDFSEEREAAEVFI